MAGILQLWTHEAMEMWSIGNANVLKYHPRGLWWPEFWNHKAIGMLRIGNASVWSPLKYHSSGLVAGIWQHWTQKPIGILRISNTSVLTPFKYHSSGLWWPEILNRKAIGMLGISHARKCHFSRLRWPELCNHKAIGMWRIDNVKTHTFPVGEMQHRVANFAIVFFLEKRTHSFHFPLVARKEKGVGRTLE